MNGRRFFRTAIASVALLGASLGYASSGEAVTVARCQCLGSPLLATSGKHGSIVAWQEGYNDTLIARRIRRDGTLGRKRKIAGRTKTFSEEGAWLAAGRSGAVVAVWEDNAGGIRARRMTRRGKLGRIHQIARPFDDEGGGDLEVDVAVNAAGDATIVWTPIRPDTSQDTGFLQTSVYARRVTARGGLGRRTALRFGDGLNRGPRVAVAPSGTAMVAWHAAKNPIAIAAVGQDRSIGLAGDTPAWAGRPQLGIDARGNATVVWLGPLGVTARRVHTGGALGPVHAISGPLEPPHYLLHSLAVDQAGNGTVLWRDSPYDVVRLRRIGANDTLGPVADLSASGVGGFYDVRLENVAPAVAVDTAGNVTAAWTRVAPPANSPTYTIEARSVTPGGRLGEIRTLFTSSETLLGPKLVADASGAVTAAWSEIRTPYGGDTINLAHL